MTELLQALEAIYEVVAAYRVLMEGGKNPHLVPLFEAADASFKDLQAKLKALDKALEAMDPGK